jgi:hypothetical protein
MDMSEYCGSKFLKLGDVREPRTEVIADCQPGNFDKPDTDSQNWIGKTIKVHAGKVPMKDGESDAILVEPISPPTSDGKLPPPPKARVVVLLLLDDGEDAGWRLASCGAGRHRRAQYPAVGVVESDLLAPDRHDRLACIARRRRIGGWRGSHLSRGGAGAQRPRASQWREPPKRRVATVDCAVTNRFTNAMSRLKCLSALASIKISGMTNSRTNQLRFARQTVAVTNRPRLRYGVQAAAHSGASTYPRWRLMS